MRNKQAHAIKRCAERAMAASAPLCDEVKLAAEKFENHAFAQSRALMSTPCRRAAKGSKPSFSQMMPRKSAPRQPVTRSTNGLEGMHDHTTHRHDIRPRLVR